MALLHFKKARGNAGAGTLSKRLMNAIANTHGADIEDDAPAIDRALTKFEILKRQLLGQDTGFIFAELLPEIAELYLPEGNARKDAALNKKRRSIQWLIEQAQKYMQMFKQVYAHLVFAEKSLGNLEKSLKFMQKIATPEAAAKFDPIRQEVEESKARLKEYRDTLQNKPIPDEKTLAETDKEIRQETEKIAETENKFSRKVASLRKAALKHTITFGKNAWNSLASGFSVAGQRISNRLSPSSSAINRNDPEEDEGYWSNKEEDEENKPERHIA